MNTVWSDLVQGIGTLYQSRALRFSDAMRQPYMQHFDLRQCRRLLEIGCGPGALSGSLSRWYPEAEVIGLDRDSEFVRFAQEAAPAARFVEGDATALPFPDESFDATISNTVSEHVPTEPFYREQYRVLRPGGVCLMLSARRGIHVAAPCIREESAFENEVWERVGERGKATDQEIGVGAYGMNELQHPIAMEKYGFRNVSTSYLTVNLTPDNPSTTPEAAQAMINAHRQTSLDAIGFLTRIAADLVTPDEIDELRRIVNARYDKRIALYDAGEKQWDTTVCLTMILRGEK